MKRGEAKMPPFSFAICIGFCEKSFPIAHEFAIQIEIRRTCPDLGKLIGAVASRFEDINWRGTRLKNGKQTAREK